MSSLSAQSGIACVNVIGEGNLNVNPPLARAPQSEKLSLQEKIRLRAYELYVQRGRQSGSELNDWLGAEAEILKAQGAGIDEASEESFPASDTPAN